MCTQYILFGHQLHNHMNRQLRGFIKSQYTCIGFGAFTLFTLSILFHIYSCPIHSSTPTPFPLSISHQLASLFPFSPLSPSLLYPTSLLAHSLPLLLLFPPSLLLPFFLSLSPPPSFSGQCLRIQCRDFQIKEEQEEMGLRYYDNDIHKTSSFIRHTVASTICYPISLD